MKQKLFVKAVSVLVAVVMGTGSAFSEEKEQKTDWMRELTSRIQFNGYAQGGYSWQDANGKQTNDFNLKRTLLWAKARITDRWSFLFMHDFSSVVQEYYMDYRVTNDKSLSVRLGQFKHSYSMENPMSPASLELIDVYSQAVLFLAGEGPDPLNGKNYGRDMGLMVYGDLFNDFLHYELAVMNGQGINCRDGNNKKDVIARLEVKPVAGLRFVVTGQKGTGHAVDSAAWNTISAGEDYRRDRISVGAEYKFGAYAPGKFKEARPVSLRGEFLAGKDGDVTSRGGYLTACVPLFQGVDAVASFDYFDRNTRWRYDQTQATAGFQYWFYKKCRLQLQYTRVWSQFQKDYNWLQAQLQFAF
jgi:hypothetical protein